MIDSHALIVVSRISKKQKMSNAPRSRLLDTANQHLDDLAALQAGIDRELNGLPVDHAFYDLSRAGPPFGERCPGRSRNRANEKVTRAAGLAK